MHRIALSISLKPTSAVHFSAADNMCPHAAQTLSRPAQWWMCQRVDIPHNSSRVQEAQKLSLLILSY